MGAVLLLFLANVLGVALLEFTNINDAYIVITMAAIIIGAFWKLRMEQQKIKMENDTRDKEYAEKVLEQDKKMNDIIAKLGGKVDISICTAEHMESKRMFTDITHQIGEMNKKIDQNHGEVLQTIIQVMNTTNDRGI